jgi:hypothetical protein
VVLARLGALRTLEAHFVGPAAAAAAGLHRLQDVTALVEMALGAAGPISPIQLAEGCCLRFRGSKALRCFDTSQVHVLELHDVDHGQPDLDATAVSLVLRSSPQLRGLQLCCSQALHPQMLQAMAACSQLASLDLWVSWRCNGQAAPAADGLAQGCRQLRQLTLQRIQQLSADTLPALIRLPGLRLLRLLGCSKAVCREQCQALVGRLGLHWL